MVHVWADIRLWFLIHNSKHPVGNAELDVYAGIHHAVNLFRVVVILRTRIKLKYLAQGFELGIIKLRRY